MREVALELPKVAWRDVGGLDAVKQRLKEAVEWPQEASRAAAAPGGQGESGSVITSHDAWITSLTASGLGIVPACLACALTDQALCLASRQTLCI